MKDEPVTLLPSTSPLSKAIYGAIRSVVPWAAWPPGEVRVICHLAADGMALDSYFRGFGPIYAKRAAEAVRAAGVDLVLLSPLAPLAGSTYQLRSWRDALLYALLPLLFAIPLVGGIWGRAMPFLVAAFLADAGGLLLFQSVLGRRRSRLVLNRFAVDLPVPRGHRHFAEQEAEKS